MCSILVKLLDETGKMLPFPLTFLFRSGRSKNVLFLLKVLVKHGIKLMRDERKPKH